MEGVVSVRGDLPLVIVAQDTLKVFGRITAASDGSVAYAGGFAPNATGDVGNGPGAGQRGLVGQFRPSSGGSFCGVGGRGATPMAVTASQRGRATAARRSRRSSVDRAAADPAVERAAARCSW